MGRPPGVPGRGNRGRYPPEWELRDPRFEELDSEDEDGYGVIVDRNSFAAREARAREAFASEDPYFDGRDRFSRHGMYDYYGDDLDYGEGIEYQVAVREKEEALLESALERIRRARAKGKTNVNLSEEEMEALERRRDPQPEPAKPPLASPPATPAKSVPKGKVSSRSNSSSNLASKARKRNSGLFGSSPSPAKSNSKAKVNRKSSAEQALIHPATQYPQGMMVPGPNGVPVYAPIGYYGPPSPEMSRSRPSSKPTSRAGSKHRRRESTPPDRADVYAQYPPRYYPSPVGIRPESSGSNRSLPDDIEWHPPAPRHRSTSNVQHGGYPSDYDNAPALPAAQGRRNFTSPPDVRYAGFRRTTPSSALGRPVPKHSSHSDPAAPGRIPSGLSQEIGDSATSDSSDSDSDEQVVQVDILPDDPARYAITRAALPAPPVSGNEGRKRRTGRR